MDKTVLVVGISGIASYVYGVNTKSYSDIYFEAAGLAAIGYAIGNFNAKRRKMMRQPSPGSEGTL